MKIKLSKSQWEMIGKKAGWVKEAQQVINKSRAGELLYYQIDRLIIEGIPDTDKYSDLSSSESQVGYRVIGGDKGDLHFKGYTVNQDDNITELYKPVLRTSLDLNSDEAISVANQILSESFSSIGWESIYHS